MSGRSAAPAADGAGIEMAGDAGLWPAEDSDAQAIRDLGVLKLYCGLPDAAGVLRVHRLAYVATECFAELVEVLDRAVDAPAAR